VPPEGDFIIRSSLSDFGSTTRWPLPPRVSVEAEHACAGAMRLVGDFADVDCTLLDVLHGLEERLLLPAQVVHFVRGD